VQQARNQLFLPSHQHEHDERIRAFLANALAITERGIEAPARPQYALVWWEKPFA
jgi:hypothetical protein